MSEVKSTPVEQPVKDAIKVGGTTGTKRVAKPRVAKKTTAKKAVAKPRVAKKAATKKAATKKSATKKAAPTKKASAAAERAKRKAAREAEREANAVKAANARAAAIDSGDLIVGTGGVEWHRLEDTSDGHVVQRAAYILETLKKEKRPVTMRELMSGFGGQSTQYKPMLALLEAQGEVVKYRARGGDIAGQVAYAAAEHLRRS